MAMDFDHTTEDELKVFVSRLPASWDDQILFDQFSATFGPVRKATVRVDAEEKSRGFGFVIFADEGTKKLALAQRTIHVQKKTVMIREVERDRNEEDGEVGICYAWRQRNCTRGDACKFRHDGEGACVQSREAGQAPLPKKCIAFRKKGRCSKGMNSVCARGSRAHVPDVAIRPLNDR